MCIKEYLQSSYFCKYVSITLIRYKYNSSYNTQMNLFKQKFKRNYKVGFLFIDDYQPYSFDQFELQKYNTSYVIIFDINSLTIVILIIMFKIDNLKILNRICKNDFDRKTAYSKFQHNKL